jgi:hypothetical protein
MFLPKMAKNAIRDSKCKVFAIFGKIYARMQYFCHLWQFHGTGCKDIQSARSGGARVLAWRSGFNSATGSMANGFCTTGTNRARSIYFSNLLQTPKVSANFGELFPEILIGKRRGFLALSPKITVLHKNKGRSAFNRRDVDGSDLPPFRAPRVTPLVPTGLIKAGG